MTIALLLEQKGSEKGTQPGEREGREEGRPEGEPEAKLGVARRMPKMGMPHDAVLEATGLFESALAQLHH